MRNSKCLKIFDIILHRIVCYNELLTEGLEMRILGDLGVSWETAKIKLYREDEWMDRYIDT